MKNAIFDLLRDEQGQGLVEYALILAFVVFVIYTSMTLLGKKNNNSLSNSASQIPG